MNLKPPTWTCAIALIFALTFSISNYCFSQVSPGISAPGDGFSAGLFSVVGGEAPSIGEWTHSGGPDESIVLTGHNLSRFTGVEEGKDSRFMVYGSGGIKREGKIQRLEEGKAVITLSKELPSWSMYLLQAGNDAGWGPVVAINKTEENKTNG